MNLFRFGNPDFLYLLLLLPVIFAVWLLSGYRRRKAMAKLGDKELVKKLMPDLSGIRPSLKIALQLMVVVLITIILARPQFGSKIEEVRRQGVEVIIALDISNSMLAEDIQPNRLERAKQAITRLVETLDNDKIGLIVFAGNAYTQIPVTTDYISAKMFMSTITPEIAPRQGTSIGSAIDLGIRSFSPGIDKSKALIIITDGENHEDNPVEKAREAAAEGVIVHTIGIGSAGGVPISMNINGKREFLKDPDGNTVITKLDENVLKEVAVAGNGMYVRASNTSIGLNQIFDEIRQMKKQELKGTIYTEYNDQFQIFAGASLLLLLIDFAIMNRKNRRFANLRLFKFKI